MPVPKPLSLIRTLACFAVLSGASSGLAADGTWNNTTGGSWDTPGNWVSATADGAGSTATFNRDITADTTVTLGSPRIIGNLLFGDTNTATAASWFLTNGGTSSNTLTLSATTPTITVNALGTGATATISAIVAGNQGLTKAGAGTLVLTGVNTYSGGTTVTAGSIGFNSIDSFGTGGITLNGGGLRWETGNTTDISTRTITIGASGGSLNTNGNNVILNNSIGNSGAGRLTKSGSGTLTLAVANTHTGGTTISGGTLAINHANALGTGSLTLNGTTSFTNTTAAAITLATNNAQSWAGDFTFASGSSPLDMGTGTVTLNKGSGLFITISSSLTVGGVIQNGTTNTIQKAGTGTLTLSGLSTFTGGLNASSGRLNINNGGNSTASAVGTGRLTIGNDVNFGNTSGAAVKLNTNNLITFSGHSVYQGPDDLDLGNGAVSLGGTGGSSSTFTVNGAKLTIGGDMSEVNAGRGIVKAGSGTLVLAGNNGYTGSTVVRRGTLVAGSNVPVSANGAFGNAASSIALADGTSVATDDIALQIGGAYTVGRSITANLNNSTGSTTIGAINATGTTATYSGAVTLNRNVILASQNAGATTNFSGQISQSGGTRSITINGAGNNGTVILSNAAGNSYTGTTLVASGTLLVNNTSGFGTGTGTVTVNAGASLGGSGTVGNIAGAGRIAPGNSPGIFTASSIDPSGGMDFSLQLSTATPTWSNASAPGNDLLHLTSAGAPIGSAMTSANSFDIYLSGAGTFLGGIFTDRNSDFTALVENATFNFYLLDGSGAVVYDGQNYTLLTSGASWDVVQVASADFASGTVTNGWAMQITAVPEPSVTLLMAAGAVVMVLRRRRA